MSSKHILVTGASKGVGRATAAELARRGHNVSVVARSEEKLKQLQTEFPDAVRLYPADLTNVDQIEQLGKHLEIEDPLQCVIHNAGGLINKKFTDLTDADWYQLIEINLMSAVRIIRSFVPLMAENSHVVSVGSMGGFMGAAKFQGLSAYSTTKGALTTLSECLAVELKQHKINSNCLCLGAVHTEMFEMAFPGKHAPVKPDQIADFISDFATKGHHFFNGKVLPVAIQEP